LKSIASRVRQLLPMSHMLLGLLLLGSVTAQAANVGDQLKNPTVRDANDGPATIPSFGNKVLAIFYTDPDVSDQNDPFADKLKAAKLDETVYKGIGIANMKDTWLPNSVIRSIVRRKIEKYDATILTDPERLLVNAWSLGDCNDKSVVIIVDKKGKLQYLKKGPMYAKEMEDGMALVRRLMAE